MKINMNDLTLDPKLIQKVPSYREACIVYFPLAQKFISLDNEDIELVQKILSLIKNHPKLVDIYLYNKFKSEITKENNNERQVQEKT